MSTPEHDDKLIQRFFADAFAHELTPELVDELEAWVRADPANARTLAELGLMEQLMVAAQQEADASAVLELLLEQEEKAEPIELVSLSTAQDTPQKDDPNALSAHDFAAAGSYLLRHALLSKPAILAYAAAVVLLAAIVLNPWGGRDDSNDAPIADNTADESNDPIEPGPVDPALNNPVATLTATHDAQWTGGPASAGLGIGDELHPNQRLTLTAGFAEITTAQGAIAILQAPATIELTYNNAVRLHTGKLVGICETDASKGFVVRTPHLEVTDLGTRFGVDASDRNVTQVHVIEGEVQVARQHASSSAVVRENLVAGDAVLASSSSDELTRIQTNDLRFATLLAFDADLSERRGLVAHWRFDDPQQLGLNAYRGIEDLQAQGDATHTPQGRFGGGLLLDGDDDALFAATFPEGIPSGGAAHTVALWIKPTATGKGGFYSWGTAKRVDRSTGLRFHEDGVSHYFWETNGLNDLMAAEQAVAGVGVDFTEGGWTHVALTWDGHTRKLYLNGLLVIEGTRQAPDVTPGNFMIGSTPKYGGFAGTLDEVVIFGRALDSGEITAVMQGAIPQTR